MITGLSRSNPYTQNRLAFDARILWAEQNPTLAQVIEETAEKELSKHELVMADTLDEAQKELGKGEKFDILVTAGHLDDPGIERGKGRGLDLADTAINRGIPPKNIYLVSIDGSLRQPAEIRNVKFFDKKNLLGLFGELKDRLK